MSPFPPTADIGASPFNENRDYLLISVAPKGEPSQSYRLSVGAASVLIAELTGALAEQVQS